MGYQLSTITSLCTSPNAMRDSVVVAAIEKSGPSSMSTEELKTAGYRNSSEERTDFSRFVEYLPLNPMGVQMVGVVIDYSLVLRIALPSLTALLTLMSYLLSATGVSISAVEDEVKHTLHC